MKRIKKVISNSWTVNLRLNQQQYFNEIFQQFGLTVVVYLSVLVALFIWSETNTGIQYNN